MPAPGEISEYLTHLDKERGQSPHTVKAYGRDLAAFAEFCDRHYGGAWSWGTVDRLGMRGFLGDLQRRGLSKRSAARALSAVRSLYRFLQENHGVATNIARAAKVPKLDKRLPTYMGREQTQALFDWAEARAQG
ncbi:MAG: site-specific integrase, partial [Gemmatimonadales bacterium]